MELTHWAGPSTTVGAAKRAWLPASGQTIRPHQSDDFPSQKFPGMKERSGIGIGTRLRHLDGLAQSVTLDGSNPRRLRHCFASGAACWPKLSCLQQRMKSELAFENTGLTHVALRSVRTGAIPGFRRAGKRLQPADGGYLGVTVVFAAIHKSFLLRHQSTLLTLLRAA